MENIKAAPIVRQMAKEDGVDLSQITGTGREGFITKADYEAHTGKPANVPTVPRERPNTRSPMNHLTDQAEIGGIKFRRERSGMDHSTNQKLGIPTRYLNKELNYRWVNDDHGRVERLREIGYEAVEPSALSQDEQIAVRRRTGTKKDGSGEYAVLMATPKDWYKERRQKAEDTRKEKEVGMFRSPVDDSGKPLGTEFYAKRGVDSGYRDNA
jgi:pyruvate/2-oxoglutarate dehydrogenase complex dihydrolipoamide acyltransferase (E2) component